MRITAPHHCATVLENLHRLDVWLASEFAELFRPGVNHATDFRYAHTRHREIVPGE